MTCASSPDLDVAAKDDEDQDHVNDGLSRDEEIRRDAEGEKADEQGGPDRHGDEASLETELQVATKSRLVDTSLLPACHRRVTLTDAHGTIHKLATWKRCE